LEIKLNLILAIGKSALIFLALWTDRIAINALKRQRDAIALRNQLLTASRIQKAKGSLISREYLSSIGEGI